MIEGAPRTRPLLFPPPKRNLPKRAQQAIDALRRAKDGTWPARRAHADLAAAAQRYKLVLDYWPDEFSVPRILRVRSADGVRFRIRRVCTRSNPSQTFELYSEKMGLLVQCEYFYEPDFMMILETRWDIKAYWEQAHVLWFLWNSKVRTYVADFEALLGASALRVRDVKSDDWKTRKPDDEERYECIKSAYALLGIDFGIRTASQIRAQPRYHNCRGLFEYLDVVVPDSEYRTMSSRFDSATQLCVGDIVSGPHRLARDVVARLIAQGDLRVDLDHGHLFDSQGRLRDDVRVDWLPAQDGRS